MSTPTQIPEMLKLDYEKTLAAIDKHDGHVQEIKNWSITACGGVLAFGFKEHQWPIATVAALLAIGFWFVALICKTLLIAARSHAQRLEELIQSGNSELEKDYRFGLVRAAPKLTVETLMRTAVDPIGWHVTLFYSLIIFATILADLYILFSK
jgi:hypothetical protein